ncbi:hypothetical protein K402DRAFT_147153 [Aulographum hederae CBS 113979]|uniref:Uncharacterized protein n=1 Tax=Aulographum hederae CBS 113979 TaxID=1176131 RepID=A0A6G1GTZ2_9PEZI|nr:hypothetical protein K402DRAFT_147153 [Aulographum hederae CBS 113979]
MSYLSLSRSLPTRASTEAQEYHIFPETPRPAQLFDAHACFNPGLMDSMYRSAGLHAPCMTHKLKSTPGTTATKIGIARFQQRALKMAPWRVILPCLYQAPVTASKGRPVARCKVPLPYPYLSITSDKQYCSCVRTRPKRLCDQPASALTSRLANSTSMKRRFQGCQVGLSGRLPSASRTTFLRARWAVCGHFRCECRHRVCESEG